MHDRLHSHLLNLTEKECRDFLFWLESPALFNSERLGRLARVLLKKGKSASRKRGDSKKPLRGSEGTGSASYQYLRGSQLHTLLMTFLAWKRLKGNPALIGLLALDELKDRGWDDLFEVQNRKVERQLKNDGHGVLQYHSLTAKLLDMVDMHEEYAHKPGSHARFQQILHHTDMAFLLRKMELICRARGHELLYPEYPHRIDLEQEVTSHLDGIDLKAHPLLLTFHLLHKVLVNPNLPDYQLLRRHLKRMDERIMLSSQSAMTDVYTTLINLNRLGRLPDVKGTDQEVLSLYLEQLDNKLLLVNERIGHRQYLNLVTMMLMQRKIKQARNFTEEYRHLLVEGFSGSVHGLARVRILMHENKIPEALRLVNATLTRATKNIDPMVKLNLLGVKVRILHDTEEYHAGIAATKVLLNRTGEPDGSEADELKRWKNFGRLILDIMEIHLMAPSDKRKGRLQKLKAAFGEKVARAAYSQWLREAFAQVD